LSRSIQRATDAATGNGRGQFSPLASPRSLRMILSIFALMARNRPNWTSRFLRARSVLSVGSGAIAMSLSVESIELASYSGIRYQPGRALAL